MLEYCEQSDLYSYGLPRGGLSNPARLVDRTSASADTFTLDQHALSDGDPVQFRAESGGTLPDPIVEGTEYFAIYVNDNVFQVSATLGGAAVTLTTAGEDVLVTANLPIAAAIDWASELINDMLPAHIVPLTAPYPAMITMVCAQLAAGKLMANQGNGPTDLAETVKYAQARLERWGKGVPIRGTNAPDRHNLAVAASAAYKDSRGWRTDETI